MTINVTASATAYNGVIDSAIYVLRGRRRGLSLLGGLLTSGLGGALINAAIKHVLDQSRHRRHSWPVAPDEVEKALGYERIQWLEKRPVCLAPS